MEKRCSKTIFWLSEKPYKPPKTAKQEAFRWLRDAEAAGSNPVASTKNRQVSTCRFFIHCESNGISSRAKRASHHRRCISSATGCISFRNDDIQNFVLMICNSCGIDDIHGFCRDLCKSSNSYAKMAKISFS